MKTIFRITVLPAGIVYGQPIRSNETQSVAENNRASSGRAGATTCLPTFSGPLSLPLPRHNLLYPATDSLALSFSSPLVYLALQLYKEHVNSTTRSAH